MAESAVKDFSTELILRASSLCVSKMAGSVEIVAPS